MKNQVPNVITWTTESVLFSERRISAKFVNGPLANKVILDPGCSDFTMDFQTSSAVGCPNPWLPLISGLYLKHMHKM